MILERFQNRLFPIYMRSIGRIHLHPFIFICYLEPLTLLLVYYRSDE